MYFAKHIIYAVEQIVFIFYLILFTWLVTRIPFFINSNLGKTTLILLFLLKIAAGLGYAWFYSQPNYIKGSDTWRFFALSKIETKQLLSHPFLFIKDLFSYGYEDSGNVFSGSNSYWNDLKSNIIIKLMAVCNVFTFTNYYANIIFFNFLFFFGPVALYRLLNSIYSGKRWLLILFVFCMPSFLFWCSGIHKDGLLFATITVSLFAFNKCLESSFRIKHLLLIGGCIVVAFALRNYVALAIVPVLLTWWMAEKMKQRKWSAFLYMFIIGGILFFGLSQLDAKLDFPNYLSIKQHEFTTLQGNSSIISKPLEPTLIGFVSYFPFAADMAFLQPHISEAKTPFQLFACAEALLILGFIMIGILFISKSLKISSLIWACFSLAFLFLLIAGYTVTFSGAIVRYRSIALPLIISPLILLISSSIQKKKST